MSLTCGAYIRCTCGNVTAVYYGETAECKCGATVEARIEPGGMVQPIVSNAPISAIVKAEPYRFSRAVNKERQVAVVGWLYE